jgi:hypothetical protein
VTAIAISIGGNVFQMIVIDPIWSASPPESVRWVSGTPLVSRLARFHANPLGLIGLLALLVSPLLAWDMPALRTWLLLAIAIQAVIILGTVLYVWPINKVLFEQTGEGFDAGTITTMARRWLLADRIRLVFRLASFLCLLRAMSLSGPQR